MTYKDLLYNKSMKPKHAVKINSMKISTKIIQILYISLDNCSFCQLNEENYCREGNFGEFRNSPKFNLPMLYNHVVVVEKCLF